MSARHTPGPWEAVGNLVRTARRPEDMSGLLVAECSLHNDGRHADARLIAAAPELLEALRDLVEAVEDPEASSLMRLNAARAAIAKATGGGS